MGIRLKMVDQLPPVDADIVLKIDYDESAGSAARSFEIAAELIRSLEQLDQILTHSIDLKLETSLIVEDLQKSSLRIFLKNVLTGIPDEALKDGDFKKVLGHYLLKSKHAVLDWLDKPEDQPKRIEDLTEEIAKLARETDLRRLPDYPPPNATKLAQPLDKFQEAKKKFRSNESLTITLGKEDYQVNLDEHWLPSENLTPSDEDQELVSEQDVFLIIGKPDLIGTAKWSFRHGKTSVTYKIVDQEWLDEFHQGKYPLKPGDALRVRIRVEHKYDRRGDLIESTEAIIKVFSVIEGDEEQEDLFPKP